MIDKPFGFYPWLTDWLTIGGIVIGGLLFVLGLYAAMRQGRIEETNTDDPGKEPIHHYAGIVSTDSNKPTVFITFLIIVAMVWVVGYVIAQMGGIAY